LRLFRMLRDQSARYHHLSLFNLKVGPRDARQEHHDIAEAVIAGKVELGCALLVEHSAKTVEIVLAQLSEQAG
ncbi:MAG: hypothetical protein WAT93_01305, partial [Pontixanthobacter sp.]